VLTTPEVITQVLMAIPLLFLYEVSVWIAWYWEQEDRTKARRSLLIAVICLIALGVLMWFAYKRWSPIFHGWFH
jgi:Sec-independent protein secretion pathway component TatC